MCKGLAGSKCETANNQNDQQKEKQNTSNKHVWLSQALEAIASLQNKDVSFDLENVKTDVVNTDAFFHGYLELFLFHQNVL